MGEMPSPPPAARDPTARGVPQPCPGTGCYTSIEEEGELNRTLDEWENLVGSVGLPHSSLPFSKAETP